MRIAPRRIVWHFTSPASATTVHWHESRNSFFRCDSAGVGSESSDMPLVTSTMHSLHLPFFRHDVGTRTPIDSARSKIDAPGGASVVSPLIVSVTGIAVSYSLSPVSRGEGDRKSTRLNSSH